MQRVKDIHQRGFRALRIGLLCIAIAFGMLYLVRAVLTYIEPSRAYKASEIAPGRIAAPKAEIVTSPAFNFEFDAFHREGGDLRTAPAAPLIGADAPETDLNLTLTGRRASGGGDGSAALRLPDGKQETFQRGEKILRNVTLEAVYPTHIIISRNGEHERVTFERTSGTLFQTEIDEAATRGDITINQAEIETLSQNLDARAQQALEGFTPDSFFKSIRPSPVREAGQVIGYRIQSRSRALDLAELGLKPGDIVTHISGTDLRQGVPDFNAIQQQISQNPSAANLTLNRDGEIVTIGLN